jgi:predicted nucleotidyltransferase
MNSANAIPSERVAGLYIGPHELEIVQRILRGCIPERRVWAFGSRATGVRLKRFSDLDLVVEGKLSLPERARLADEFDESPLPFKVDIVELGEADETFANRIRQDFVSVDSTLIGQEQ